MVSQTSGSTPGMREGSVFFFIIGQELYMNIFNYISTKLVQYLHEHEYKT